MRHLVLCEVTPIGAKRQRTRPAAKLHIHDDSEKQTEIVREPNNKAPSNRLGLLVRGHSFRPLIMGEIIPVAVVTVLAVVVATLILWPID